MHYIPALQSYDTEVSLTASAETLRKGQSAYFQVVASITIPSTELEFEVSQPLGYNVISTNLSFPRTLFHILGISNNSHATSKE